MALNTNFQPGVNANRMSCHLYNSVSYLFDLFRGSFPAGRGPHIGGPRTATPIRRRWPRTPCSRPRQTCSGCCRCSPCRPSTSCHCHPRPDRRSPIQKKQTLNTGPTWAHDASFRPGQRPCSGPLFSRCRREFFFVTSGDLSPGSRRPRRPEIEAGHARLRGPNRPPSRCWRSDTSSPLTRAHAGGTEDVLSRRHTE